MLHFKTKTIHAKVKMLHIKTMKKLHNIRKKQTKFKMPRNTILKVYQST